MVIQIIKVEIPSCSIKLIHIIWDTWVAYTDQEIDQLTAITIPHPCIVEQWEGIVASFGEDD